MKPEDVAEDMLDRAMEAYWLADGGTRGGIRAIIAAVAPMIEARERERIAAWHDEQAAGQDALAEHAAGADDHAWTHHRHLASEHRQSAAAIRARGTP